MSAHRDVAAAASHRVVAATAAHRVVATAGHVDHGKSSLIVALTGIDPDRWDEEKRRGLTIDLGYAWCDPAQRPRGGVRGCPRARAVHHQHAGGRRAGALGAVRGGRRRGVEAPVRRAPADPGRPRRACRRRGADQDRPGGTRRRRRRGRAASATTSQAARWPMRRSCRWHRHRRRRRRHPAGAGRDAGRGASLPNPRAPACSSTECSRSRAPAPSSPAR